MLPKVRYETLSKIREQDRTRIATLESENASLRKKVEQEEARFHDIADDLLMTGMRLEATEARATRAEAEAAALRKALEEIRDMPVMNAVEIYEIARAALKSAERQP